MKKALYILSFFSLLAAVPAEAASPKLLGEYNDWVAYY